MRLFVALDLPADVRAALAAWAAHAAPNGVRPVPVESLHVTLAFLGPREEGQAAEVRALLGVLARPLEPLRTAGALWLPPRRPGVLAVALEAGAGLADLQAELVAELRSAIGFDPERRRFRPHVTVGRVKRGARIDVRGAFEPPAPQLRFAAPALTLYRSHLSAQGARYEPLAAVELV